MLGIRSISHCRPRPSFSLVSYQYRFATTKSYDPLRVLFCGSDEFSIASLQALDHERRAGSGYVASIDVVCRPEKPVRRHLRAVREVPIATVARNLGLPLHQIDTFTGWTVSVLAKITENTAHTDKPPTHLEGPMNLVAAVSFGLRVPARILSLANKTDRDRFPGPAPLHHTLLADRKTTGVTLQTLHPIRMDGGRILAQTPYPGIEHQAKTVEELQALTAPLGADMLIQSLKNGSFVPPLQDAGWYSGCSAPRDFQSASKIGPKDRHLDWTMWSSDDILRRQRVIGPLWNMTETLINSRNGERREAKRIIWEHGFQLLEEECHLFPRTGHPIIVGLHGPTPKVFIRTCDGNVLVADSIKVEGEVTTEAFRAAKRNGLAPFPDGLDKPTHFPHDFVAFHSPLT
ncbi:MAG: hypothetical protein Q9171_003652 [Xanthocarpia ochracea]